MTALSLGERTEVQASRVLTSDAASALVGTPVGTTLTPGFKSPRPGTYTAVVDAETGDDIAYVTRLPEDRRKELRAALLGSDKIMSRQLRGKGAMVGKGASFGFMPKRPIAGREACSASILSGRMPQIQDILDRLAVDLAEQFAELNRSQFDADSALLGESILNDWRLGEKSLWTSGVINQTTTLPYHRDGNNFDTWSAMPSIRYGMNGGHLHLPEYDLTLPIGDGDVSWFFGKKVVHGVTPMQPRPGKKDTAYRYTCVFYALQGMKNCRTYAEETTQAAARRTERERRMAAEAREQLGLNKEQA
ncbi:hypothetical protein [Brevibacterium moorei]|uniref:hypothetical protein n=1 Tax=Brevibacterium moorei TaxID=2968457 RepID=UPI00211D0BFD|nr:hypothetical protein [Brevibacterium sp. 68QC2CO]MCQ9384419.1 hypothetical protein [Brevibacterium sp. 68QC2CO]